ncbi:hypothetical protein Tco_0304915 [Tanacetum coccineum]
MNIMRLVSYINVIPMKPIGTILFSANDVTKGPVLTVNIKGPVSFAKLVTREPSKKTVNFRTLLSPASNRSDVAISLESIRAISERFANSVYGFFLGKRVAYPVFSSKYGMDAMLDNGPWFIRNTTLIMKKWTPDANLLKEDVCRSSYVRVMIELQADMELRDTIVVVFPKLVEVNNSNPFDAFNLVENDDDLGTNGGNSKLAEKRDNSSVVSSDHGTSSEAFAAKKVDSLVNSDSDREVEEVFNKNAGFMASTSSKVENYSKSGSGVESTSMYEQWRETYNEDSYADDDFDNCGLTNASLKLANAFDISLRGQL